MRRGKVIPSCGGRTEAAIIRSKDDRSVGDLTTKLPLNLWILQFAGSYRKSFEVPRNTSSGYEGLENGDAARKRSEDLHLKDRFGKYCVEITLATRGNILGNEWK